MILLEVVKNDSNLNYFRTWSPGREQKQIIKTCDCLSSVFVKFVLELHWAVSSVVWVDFCYCSRINRLLLLLIESLGWKEPLKSFSQTPCSVQESSHYPRQMAVQLFLKTLKDEESIPYQAAYSLHSSSQNQEISTYFLLSYS